MSADHCTYSTCVPSGWRAFTQTLRGLEADGIVARYDHHSADPRVDYSLTAAGIDLLTTVHELCGWSRTHLDSLLAAHPTADPR